ncbi:MAG: hypothetical protein ACOVOR_05370 [Rhabdochlamydiaceae bacterium]
MQLSSKITLKADLAHELNWDEARLKALELKQRGHKISWVLDFGWSETGLSLKNESHFLTFSLALEKFNDEFWSHFSDSTVEMTLYEGDSLHSLLFLDDEETDFQNWLIENNKISSWSFFDRYVFYMNAFGEYLQRLCVFLPEELTLSVAFRSCSSFSKAQQAFLFSQNHFNHIRVKWLYFDSAPLAVCLPLYAQVDFTFFDLIEDVIDSITDQKFRFISEELLTEEWEAVDTLMIFSDYLSALGKRKLQGFNVTGGKFITIGRLVGFNEEISWEES